jgi:hypothetical protein
LSVSHWSSRSNGGHILATRGDPKAGDLEELLYLVPSQTGLLWSERLSAALRLLLDPGHEQLAGLTTKQREGGVAEQHAGLFVGYVRGLRVHIQAE